MSAPHSVRAQTLEVWFTLGWGLPQVVDNYSILIPHFIIDVKTTLGALSKNVVGIELD